MCALTRREDGKEIKMLRFTVSASTSKISLLHTCAGEENTFFLGLALKRPENMKIGHFENKEREAKSRALVDVRCA